MEDLTKARHLPPDEIEKMRQQVKDAEIVIRQTLKKLHAAKITRTIRPTKK
ncbi:hypothetical protein NBRC116494_17550 [Aurantivibrio plasticivorans]